MPPKNNRNAMNKPEAANQESPAQNQGQIYAEGSSAGSQGHLSSSIAEKRSSLSLHSLSALGDLRYRKLKHAFKSLQAAYEAQAKVIAELHLEVEMLKTNVVTREEVLALMNCRCQVKPSTYNERLSQAEIYIAELIGQGKLDDAKRAASHFKMASLLVEAVFPDEWRTTSFINLDKSKMDAILDVVEAHFEDLGKKDFTRKDLRTFLSASIRNKRGYQKRKMDGRVPKRKREHQVKDEHDEQSQEVESFEWLGAPSPSSLPGHDDLTLSSLTDSD